MTAFAAPVWTSRPASRRRLLIAVALVLALHAALLLLLRGAFPGLKLPEWTAFRERAAEVTLLRLNPSTAPTPAAAPARPAKAAPVAPPLPTPAVRAPAPTAPPSPQAQPLPAPAPAPAAPSAAPSAPAPSAPAGTAPGAARWPGVFLGRGAVKRVDCYEPGADLTPDQRAACDKQLAAQAKTGRLPLGIPPEKEARFARTLKCRKAAAGAATPQSVGGYLDPRGVTVPRGVPDLRECPPGAEE